MSQFGQERSFELSVTQHFERRQHIPQRLCRRYRKLAARGKNPNIAVVAVARELSGLIWDISRLAMSLAVPNEAT